MNWSGCNVVESIPGRLSGLPVLRNTRMPADGVVENARTMSVEEIADEFDLNEDDVRSVITYARSPRELSQAL